MAEVTLGLEAMEVDSLAVAVVTPDQEALEEVTLDQEVMVEETQDQEAMEVTQALEGTQAMGINLDQDSQVEAS